MPELGKLLILIGAFLLVLGLAFTFGERFFFLRIGRLPGDMVFRRGNFTFYFPLVTSIVLSLILTALFWLLRRR